MNKPIWSGRHGCVTVVAEKQETGERCKKTGESKEKVKMYFSASLFIAEYKWRE